MDRLFYGSEDIEQLGTDLVDPISRDYILDRVELALEDRKFLLCPGSAHVHSVVLATLRAQPRLHVERFEEVVDAEDQVAADRIATIGEWLPGAPSFLGALVRRMRPRQQRLLVVSDADGLATDLVALTGLRERIKHADPATGIVLLVSFNGMAEFTDVNYMMQTLQPMLQLGAAQRDVRRLAPGATNPAAIGEHGQDYWAVREVGRPAVLWNSPLAQAIQNRYILAGLMFRQRHGITDWRRLAGDHPDPDSLDGYAELREAIQDARARNLLRQEFFPSD